MDSTSSSKRRRSQSELLADIITNLEHPMQLESYALWASDSS